MDDKNLNKVKKTTREKWKAFVLLDGKCSWCRSGERDDAEKDVSNDTRKCSCRYTEKYVVVDSFKLN